MKICVAVCSFVLSNCMIQSQPEQKKRGKLCHCPAMQPHKTMYSFWLVLALGLSHKFADVLLLSLISRKLDRYPVPPMTHIAMREKLRPNADAWPLRSGGRKWEWSQRLLNVCIFVIKSDSDSAIVANGGAHVSVGSIKLDKSSFGSANKCVLSASLLLCRPSHLRIYARRYCACVVARFYSIDNWAWGICASVAWIRAPLINEYSEWVMHHWTMQIRLSEQISRWPSAQLNAASQPTEQPGIMRHENGRTGKWGRSFAKIAPWPTSNIQYIVAYI